MQGRCNRPNWDLLQKYQPTVSLSITILIPNWRFSISPFIRLLFDCIFVTDRNPKIRSEMELLIQSSKPNKKVSLSWHFCWQVISNCVGALERSLKARTEDQHWAMKMLNLQTLITSTWLIGANAISADEEWESVLKEWMRFSQTLQQEKSPFILPWQVWVLHTTKLHLLNTVLKQTQRQYLQHLFGCHVGTTPLQNERQKKTNNPSACV